MGVGLHSARHYHNVRLGLSMLRVAAEFWDPTRHVFCFNQCELCPMIEEFAALVNHTNLRYILLPLKRRRHLMSSMNA